MQPSLENLFAKLFISRSEPYAEQHSDGTYAPVRSKITRQALTDHLAGTSTYGHYLLNTDNTCKIVAFDIDFTKAETSLPQVPYPDDESGVRAWEASFIPRSPRDIWKYMPRDAAAPYMRTAMRTLAHLLERELQDLMLPTAVAYSGNKGLHVYGFFPKGTSATECREAGEIALETLDMKAISRASTYAWTRDAFPEHKMFEVELFPKQTELPSADNLGNLMRFPLGRNLKSKHPTFFVDTLAPMGKLSPAENPVTLLDEIASQLQ